MSNVIHFSPVSVTQFCEAILGFTKRYQQTGKYTGSGNTLELENKLENFRSLRQSCFSAGV